MPTKPVVPKPRLRSSDGSFAARGTINGKLLRKVWSSPTAALSASPLAQFEAKSKVVEFTGAFVADKVDKINAVIRGVSVITSGLTARGHDLEVDGVTLTQMKKCAEAKGDQVPVKVDHKSGAAAVCGYLCNFHLDGAKLKADWHLLMTHPQKDQILEVAERMPKGVGLSASFLPPAKAEKTASGKPAARCEELISVDYVTLPAANPDGMFEAKVDSTLTAMTPEILAAIKAAITEAVAPISEKLSALETQQNLMANPPSLEEAAEMTDEELAAVGLTAADVDAAIAAHNAEVEASEGQEGTEGETISEGQEGTEGEGELATTGTPAASATGLEAVVGEIRQFAAQLRAAKAEKAQAEQDAVLADIETKFDALVAQNVELQNQVKTGGKAVSHGAGATSFTAKTGEVVNFGTKEDGEFEQLVKVELDGGKKKSLAFSTVIRANPEAYRDYQIRRGIIKS